MAMTTQDTTINITVHSYGETKKLWDDRRRNRAITAPRKDEGFFKSNVDLIDDIVSRAVKANHPFAGQLSKTNTQAWQKHTTEALGKDATLLSHIPAVSIIFKEPQQWAAVDKASKATDVVSRLKSVNTSPLVEKCKNKRWIFPEENSVSRAMVTSRGDGSSRRAGSSGRYSSVNPQSLVRWLDKVKDDGYSGAEED